MVNTPEKFNMEEKWRMCTFNVSKLKRGVGVCVKTQAGLERADLQSTRKPSQVGIYFIHVFKSGITTMYYTSFCFNCIKNMIKLFTLLHLTDAWPEKTLRRTARPNAWCSPTQAWPFKLLPNSTRHATQSCIYQPSMWKNKNFKESHSIDWRCGNIENVSHYNTEVHKQAVLLSIIDSGLQEAARHQWLLTLQLKGTFPADSKAINTNGTCWEVFNTPELCSRAYLKDISIGD